MRRCSTRQRSLAWWKRVGRGWEGVGGGVGRRGWRRKWNGRECGGREMEGGEGRRATGGRGERREEARRRGSERGLRRRVGDQGVTKMTGLCFSVVFPRLRGLDWLSAFRAKCSVSAKRTPTRPTIREPRPPHMTLSEAATRWASC